MQNRKDARAEQAAVRERHRPRFFLLDRRATHVASLATGADQELLLNTKQLAGWLGVSKQWLEIGRCRSYGPPYRRLGTKAIRYRVGDVLNWLDERSHKSTAEYRVGEV